MPKYKVKVNGCQLCIKVKFSTKEKLNEQEASFMSRKIVRGIMKAKQINSFLFKGMEYTGPIGISLEQRLKDNIHAHDLFFILEQVVDTVQQLGKNAMNTDKVVWDISHCYMNPVTKEMQFIYLPLEKVQHSSDMREFIETIVYSANPQDEDSENAIADFVYFLKGMKHFELDRIEEYIKKYDKKIVNMIKKHATGTSGFITDKPRDYIKHYHQTPGEYEDDDPATDRMDEDEDDEQTGRMDEETTQMDSEYAGTEMMYEVQYPVLYRMKTDEEIQVNKPAFRLGKERSYVDYFIGDNNFVSRSHANILTEDGTYYITDLDSANGTFLNEKKILAGQKAELHDGDLIRLANETFRFQI